MSDDLSRWESIETAPEDGTIIRYARIIDGAITFEGLAAWKVLEFPPFANGSVIEPRYTFEGWSYPEQMKRVPSPTHWNRNTE